MRGGPQANETEKRLAPETASAYVTAQGYAADTPVGITEAESYKRQATSGKLQAARYSADTPVVMVHSGSEPPMFTCHFLGWDSSKARAPEGQPRGVLESSPIGG